MTIGDKTYLIRGDVKDTDIPEHLLAKMERDGGKFDFHSHPHDNDCIPSAEDRRTMAKLKS